jgi:hypothetical protein
MEDTKTGRFVALLIVTVTLLGCSDAIVDQNAYKFKVGGTVGSATGGTTGSGGATTGYPTSATPPPDESATAEAIANQNPGMINDCTGRPIANNFLIYVVRALQQKDRRWGYMKKDGGARIPRDILAFAWGGPQEGTNNFFVIDFVSSGCNNTPSDPNFAQPATNAGVWWNVTNPNGYADNGVWSANP